MKATPSRQRESFLVFGQPDIREEEIAEVVDTLKSGWLGTGPQDQAVRGGVRRVCGCKARHCRQLLYRGSPLCHFSRLALPLGDEVITTPMTFASTLNVILHVGATPVLVDVDRDEHEHRPPAGPVAAVTDR